MPVKKQSAATTQAAKARVAAAAKKRQQLVKARAALAAKKKQQLAKARENNKIKAIQKAKAKPVQRLNQKARAKPVPKSRTLTGGASLKLDTPMRRAKQESSDNPKYEQLRTKTAPVCFYAKQGPRDYMEDTYQIMHFNINGKQGTFYGVFDGHGGKDVSYECVHKERGIFPFLIEKLRKTPLRNFSQAIKAGFLEYDKILYKKDLNAGSTAVIILFFNNKLYLINLGDSRAMIFTKTECLAVSDDHKPQKPVEKNRIYRAGHFVSPFRIFDHRPASKRFTVGDIFRDRDQDKNYIYLGGKWESISREQYKQVRDMTKEGIEDTARVSNSLALSRALGDFYLKLDKNKVYMGERSAVSMIPDVIVVDVSAKKFKGKEIYLFLASDGFWDVNRNTVGLRKELANHPKPQELCKQIVDLSYEKGSQDNTTVVLDKIIIN